MLPNDAKKHKIVDKQPSVTKHFGPEDQVARPIPYSNKALKMASIEWLIQTNQVCHSLLFPILPLIRMIIANCCIQVPCIQEDAWNCIPSQSGYLTTLAQTLKSLDHNNVQAAAVFIEGTSQCTFLPVVLCYMSANILHHHSLGPQRWWTCNVWQASNTNAYFAITRHWIEECHPRVWSIKQALLGFIQMNMAHNGACLGQVLYKVCNHLQIVPKVGNSKLSELPN